MARSLDDALPTAAKLPRWRGFNLTEMFSAKRCAPFRESDFAWMAEWGFDFARLATSYRCWTDDPLRWREMREDVLRQVDQAVEFGRHYGAHVNLCLHRAPGFCVNDDESEPFDLWKDGEALDAFAFQWRHFAERYKGIANERLSFNLVNEPIDPDPADHLRVVRRAVEEIRAADPDRLIIADGTRWAREPVEDFIDLGVAQSSHVYDPIQVCFYRMAGIPGSDTWPEPTWPIEIADPDGQWRGRWGSDRLREVCIEPWRRLEARRVGVHVGETGCFRCTPHGTALAWLGDLVSLWRQAGWGYALWNFRGPFGILDSGRADVRYEDFHGHPLDRRMLELLRADGV
jgi:endoglucanase